MPAGEPNPDEDIVAEASEPAKESAGGPSTTEESGPRPVQITAAKISAVGAVLAALLISLSAVVVVVLGYVLNGTTSVPSNAAPPPPPEASGDMPVPNCRTCISGPGGQTFTEQADGGGEKNTFRDPRTFAGLGTPVHAGQKIEVVCRFYDPHAPPSVKPGWWYLIASSPWKGYYYTVANSYLNGEPPEGPHIANVDPGVPECTSKS